MGYKSTKGNGKGKSSAPAHCPATKEETTSETTAKKGKATILSLWTAKDIWHLLVVTVIFPMCYIMLKAAVNVIKYDYTIPLWIQPAALVVLLAKRKIINYIFNTKAITVPYLLALYKAGGTIWYLMKITYWRIRRALYRRKNGKRD